jgi:murein DD-endopeptidase MepM/ murein hydrolase activator NlpD
VVKGTSALSEEDKDEKFWEDVKIVGNKEAFEAYLQNHPNGRYVTLAKASISRIISNDVLPLKYLNEKQVSDIGIVDQSTLNPQRLSASRDTSQDLTTSNTTSLNSTSQTISADTDPIFYFPHNGKIVNNFGDKNGKGIDIAGNSGDPIFASADGKVVYSGSGLRGFGKLIIIKHINGMLTSYAHNSILLVNEGQDVRQGQKISEMGSTESDQVKLHFEIRIAGKPVDPLKYLKIKDFQQYLEKEKTTASESYKQEKTENFHPANKIPENEKNSITDADKYKSDKLTATALGLTVSNISEYDMKALKINGGVKILALEGGARTSSLRAGDIIVNLGFLKKQLLNLSDFEKIAENIDKSKLIMVLYKNYDTPPRMAMFKYN